MGQTENLDDVQCLPNPITDCDLASPQRLGLDGDLTGTTLQTTGGQPLAVFGAHACVAMPVGYQACDHIEAMMPPVQTWGTQTTVGAPAEPDTPGAAVRSLAVYRVIADQPGTEVSFVPASVHEIVTLDAGEFVTIESEEDFQVLSTQATMVQQILPGAVAPGGVEFTETGDPAMTTCVPDAQALTEYVFFTPPNRSENWINVVGPSSGSMIELDGQLIALDDVVPGTGRGVARVRVEPGPHAIISLSGEAFTLTQYGYDRFTSYLYTGGSNLTPL